MPWIVPPIIATLCGTFVLTLVYWYLYSQYRERFIGTWAVGWSVYTVRFVFELFMHLYPDITVFTIGHQLSTLLSGFFIMMGTFAFLERQVSKWMVYGTVLNAVWMIIGISVNFPWTILNLPTFLFLGFIYVWTGTMLLRSKEIKGIGRQVTGWSLIIWGIHKSNYPFMRDLGPQYALWGYIFASILETIVAVGTLLVYFQKIRAEMGENEKRFRLLAENARDLVYRYRLKPPRGFEYVSPSATTISGYTPEEHYADPDLIFKIAHPEDRRFLEKIPEFISSEGDHTMVLRSIRKDGALVTTEHHVVVIRDDNGAVIGFEGIGRDVTESKQAEEALRESERRFREMLENVRLITVTLDNQGNIAFCNEYLVELSGWQKDELIGQNWFSMFSPPENRARLEASYREDISGADTYHRYENEIITRTGERHTISWNTIILRDSHGTPVAATSIGEDISERKKSMEALKRFQLLSDHARDIMLFINHNGQILEANDAAVKTYGFSREELLSKNIFDLRAPEVKSSLDIQMNLAVSKGILYETFHQCKDESIIPVEVSLQGAVIGDNRMLLAIIRDISERKRAEDIINHLAYHDPLTDLPNRILFFDRLTVALADAQRNDRMLAVMFLDLDRFKYVNDMMGHASGDRLLKGVAQHLTGCVRRNDTVARIGGDEFTLLLPQINHEEDAARVAKKIIDSFKKPRIVNGQEIQITCSIGIALYPNDGTDAETLTANADTAMYRAKEKGDNYQFYTPAMNVKAMERLSMEHALRKAVDQDEFVIHYQPQVDIREGRIVGMEALVRWKRPKHGLIMPLDFISVAEETGIIVPMGDWVLKTAVAQNKAWQDKGYPPMRISVNISASQFKQKHLVATISNVLKETGMDPGLLELEITEGTAMNDVDFSISMLSSLRDMGIRIAIDDFGTGYSSLSYLRRFPITTLKIDRSFVHDVLTDVEDAAIVGTIIVLAQYLKLDVVVEGVETEQQLKFFQQQECFEMQGYLFSEPLPANEAENLLQRAEKRS